MSRGLNDQTSRPVVVTGGAGYVGSHACKALAAAGYLPVAVDDLRRGHDWAVQWGPLERVDLRDRMALDAVFAHHRPVAVMHFAAFAYVGESVTEPLAYHENNVGGLLALLDVAGRHGVHPIVFSSSCAVYGEPETPRLREDHRRRPVNPYGATKMMCERILEDCAATGALTAVSLRYFNAAGADPDGEIGEWHDPETHLIPLAIRAAVDEGFRLNVYGSDYPTADGTAVRDYVHVADLAAAHVKALDYLLAGGDTVALNLGTGAGHSVREVVAATETALGRPVKTVDAPRRPGDPPALVADAARATALLDWRPNWTDFAAIVASAARWYTTGATIRGAV